MSHNKRRTSKEAKRLKFIRKMKDQRREAKRERDNNFPGTGRKFRIPNTKK